MEGYNEFLKLRRWFMDKLGEVDMSDGCKSYEGTFELLFSYPNYFDEENEERTIDTPDFVMVRLHCYVLGPHRHYEWRGRNILEVVYKARKEIESW